MAWYPAAPPKTAQGKRRLAAQVCIGIALKIIVALIGVVLAVAVPFALFNAAFCDMGSSIPWGALFVGGFQFRGGSSEGAGPAPW